MPGDRKSPMKLCPATWDQGVGGHGQTAKKAAAKKQQAAKKTAAPKKK